MGSLQDTYEVDRDHRSFEVCVDGVEVPAVQANAKEGWAIIDSQRPDGTYIPNAQKKVTGKVTIQKRY